jgi:hypothetical protein
MLHNIDRTRQWDSQAGEQRETERQLNANDRGERISALPRPS